MPLYEYRCRACGRQFEFLQRLDEAPKSVCPECGGELAKQLSAPAFQFKGSGWYVTDYAKKSSGGGGGDASSRSESGKSASHESTSGSSSGSDTATDSKPAAKSEAPGPSAPSTPSKTD